MHGKQSPTNGKYPDSLGNLGHAFAASLALHLIVLSVAPLTLPIASHSSLRNAQEAWQPSKITLSIRLASPSIPQAQILKPPISIPKQAQAGTQHTQPQGDFESHPPQLENPIANDIFLPEPMARGSILLRVWIDKHGSPFRLEVISSTMTREVEEQVVLRFFSARYLPGMKNGEAIEGTAEFEISADTDPATPALN